MQNYVVEILLPHKALQARSFPSLILLHFSQHTAPEYQLLGELRQLAAKSQIFVLGDSPQNEHIIQAYDKGADAYLLLPLQFEELAKKIRPRLRWYQWLGRLQKIWQSKRQSLRPIASSSFPAQLPPEAPPDLEVRFLGDFVVKDKNRRLLDLKSSRIQALFACLLYHGNKGVSRNHLIGNFWPEVREDCARNSLNVAISQLRTTLKDYFGEQEIIVFEQGNYRICKQLTIATDVARFQYWIKAGKAKLVNESAPDIYAFLKAAATYQGNFLAAFNFQEWTTSIRDRLWEHYLFALGKLVAHYLRAERYQEATRFAKLLLQEDACHELTHRQLMYAYYRLGKRTSALQQYLTCQTVLLTDLNVKPSNETEELYQIIVKQERRKVSFPLV
jgi:DNA-binding SARP family transcriptional activator